ncbi:helix-turn-helix domain-containing protein [Candidatus Mycobacterium methanotrophicum]|uniref:Helix-turn-helix domain-containing protein n=1 Tax=Candidatus Mycobacterium methanotrophicum TaxID=2943498 RepID=A0ABY4QMY7_9MYCO|nr:helix-turn-helix domain-containing protein [Candidatus Mycobacterium methanotrophicum]UQX11310.1 helix-turn-helix domain-containing protein [Candidatus Mycobacterium methanotrophicum]
MIVVRTAEWAEQALGTGQIGCPHSGCGGTLTRWGYGHRRRVRRLGAQILDVRPRRARCTRCASTQILLPASVQPRLADTTEVIGTALASKADGHGHRRIATALDRSPSTVRRWMRRATHHVHLQWLWQRGSQALIRLDPDAFNQLPRAASPLRDALTVLAAAAYAARQRLGLTEPLWTLIGLHTQGRLLAAPT